MNRWGEKKVGNGRGVKKASGGRSCGGKSEV